MGAMLYSPVMIQSIAPMLCTSMGRSYEDPGTWMGDIRRQRTQPGARL